MCDAIQMLFTAKIEFVADDVGGGAEAVVESVQCENFRLSLVT